MTELHRHIEEVLRGKGFCWLEIAYQQRVGIVDVIVGKDEPGQGIPPSTPTSGRVFQKNGYATALFGKWHCG